MLGNTAALCKTCDSCPLQSQSETYIMLAMDSLNIYMIFGGLHSPWEAQSHCSEDTALTWPVPSGVPGQMAAS